MRQGCHHIFTTAVTTAIAVFASVSACPAYASTPSYLPWTPAANAPAPVERDLIVRMKSPIRNSLVTKLVAALPTAAPQMQVINKHEGLVRFHFSNSAEAEIARALLVKTGIVHSAVPNFLYHPEVIYKAHSAPAPQTALHHLLRGLGWGGYDDGDAGSVWNSAALPQVDSPPTDVTSGDDPYASSDASMAQIDMPTVDQISDFQTGAAPVIVALIDTGVDYNHEDLSGAMWRSVANSETVGYDFAHQSTLPFDVRHFDMDGCLGDPECYLGISSTTSGDPKTGSSGQTSNPYLTNPGHGTHCAGHIGAVANNSLGIRGVGGNVQIMALKFVHDFGESDAGEGDDVAAIQSIDYAIKNGAKIINASWGNRESYSDAAKSELKQALIRAQKAGILVITAAGNDAINQDAEKNPVYPAAYASELDNILVVAATDSANDLATFSNWGPSTVHIAAPGVKIFSTTPLASFGGAQTIYNDVIVTYQSSSTQVFEIDWNGTSMATPFVAGSAALVWSKYSDENYLQIKNRLLAAAKPVATLRGKVATGGVLDVSASLGLGSNSD